MEKCNYHTNFPKYSFQQIDPKYSFHTNFPKYSFQQIEPTGKSSDVLNIQWHFLKKVPWGIVHYYWVSALADLKTPALYL